MEFDDQGGGLVPWEEGKRPPSSFREDFLGPLADEEASRATSELTLGRPRLQPWPGCKTICG